VIISRFYDALPPDTQIIEVEPVEDSWGADLSPTVHCGGQPRHRVDSGSCGRISRS